MNIDGLHKQAGSDALELHGGLPEDDEMDIAWSLYNKPVLYGDPAPNYAKAYEMVYDLKPGDIFLVIGCSFHTAIAVDLREVARSRGARIIEIQEDAAHNVRKILENIKKNSNTIHDVLRPRHTADLRPSLKIFPFSLKLYSTLGGI